MPVVVAGLWELGYNTPLLERDLWEYPLRDFAVDQWWMSPVSGIYLGDSILAEVDDLRDVIEPFDGTVVYVDEHGSECLTDGCPAHPRFTHPEHVLYVLGKASMSTMQAYARPQDKSVMIHTPQEKGMMWPHQAILIALYDRTLQWQ